ncbi:Reverse transcriptase zinc-binding domain [Sesbania bispinosa]|nr:Reverse transcriptase zinc-binding domain [Sesbania bispinosa]
MAGMDGSWNLHIFSPYLPQWAIDEITGSLPPQPGSQQDNLSWGLTSHGNFTTKSAYHLAADNFQGPVHRIWRAIWHWKGPHRLKCFLWMILKGGLKTNSLRKNRKLSISDLCPICNSHIESPLHALRDCHRAQWVWQMFQALLNAWKEACASTTATKIVIPNGTYKMNAVYAKGPCKAPVEIQVKVLLMVKVQLLGNKMIVEKTRTARGVPCAPGDSINTDGIHIGRSTNVKILNTNIATGDDCVSLGDGSKQVTVQNVNCGPGHGISVGSMGKYENEEPVEQFLVKNCTLKNTDNGVRIKTWPSSPGTSPITDMHFEDITMIDVMNPVIIDQEYCPWNQCSKQVPSKIKISKVTFKNIKGTSKSKEAVILNCSKGVPCEGVELSDVSLTFNGAPTIAKCVNVKPVITGKAPSCTA